MILLTKQFAILIRSYNWLSFCTLTADMEDKKEKCESECMLNNQTICDIKQTLRYQLSICLIIIIIIMDKISENGRNIYISNQISQTILEIDFHRTYRNE